jgi:prepilin signal peptidase PulO-like enzyme (type II secretory pathway)
MDFMVMVLAIYLLLAFWLWVAFLATGRGRDPVCWYVIGILLGCFSLPLLYLLPKKDEL